MAETFIGEIRMFAATFAPRDWAFCDGTLMAISQNEALFSLIGTKHGGDGRNSFALPEMRGRIPVHQGTGPGLTLRPMGQRGGQERVVLTDSNMPQHTHQLYASGDEATSQSPAGNVTATGQADPLVRFYSDQDPTVDMSSNSITSVGGSDSHYNMMPYTCIQFIISLKGTYPSRN